MSAAMGGGRSWGSVGAGTRTIVEKDDEAKEPREELAGERVLDALGHEVSQRLDGARDGL